MMLHRNGELDNKVQNLEFIARCAFLSGRIGPQPSATVLEAIKRVEGRCLDMKGFTGLFRRRRYLFTESRFRFKF